MHPEGYHQGDGVGRTEADERVPHPASARRQAPGQPVPGPPGERFHHHGGPDEGESGLQHRR